MAAAVVPEEIIIYEILLRLPVKSLVRYRCVCKSWNSLLYNPDYLSHLNRSISQNPKRDDNDDDDYLVLLNFNNCTPSPNYGLSIFSRKKLSETLIDNYVPPLLSLGTRYGEVYLVGSVNGLVCMAFDLLVGNDHKLILWNPTICFSETILVPKEVDDYNFFMYGFGWDSVTNDYKLIIIGCAHDDDEDFSSFFVYSYNTNHWSIIGVESPDTWCNCMDHCFILKGSPYWSKWTEEGNILKFDTRNHKCTTLKIPSDCYRYRLINLNDCLALVDYHEGSTPRVFCFDEEHNIWMHMYTLTKRFDHWDFKFYGFNYGGEIEIVFYGNKNLYLCDPKSDKIKRHPRRYHICGGCTVKSHKSTCRGGFSYTPSLVVLQGMKALHL